VNRTAAPQGIVSVLMVAVVCLLVPVVVFAEPAAPIESVDDAAVGVADTAAVAQIDSPLLERLTLPELQLGEGCVLKPIEHAVGATPIPVDSNPMITSDRRVIGFVSIFVMPPTPEEEALWEAKVAKIPPEEIRERIEELMAERTSSVRAAYIAIYESSASGPETGVFALEFMEPLTPERRETLSVEGPGGAVVASEHVAAAVWTDGPHGTCMEAARAHVESVLGE
ncbi:MAG: hypothetical protein U9Q95_01095, partial [Candidatus Eisenbacteria bacterium]|nr:hypothetical protein [Candidatus Eisenbacteria bacterium]